VVINAIVTDLEMTGGIISWIAVSTAEATMNLSLIPA